MFPDWMHTKHLGCDKLAYASVLHVLCYQLLPGSPEENVDEVWAERLSYYREHQLRNHYRQMKLGLFCKPRSPFARFPNLRGESIEVRNLGPTLLKIWTDRMDSASMLHQQVAFMLRCSVKLESMIQDHKSLVRYPAGVASAFLNTTEHYLQLSSAIARSFNESGRKLFGITTKHRILWHCADSASLVNPVKSWCYRGEDNTQHVRKMAASSLAGTK